MKLADVRRIPSRAHVRFRAWALLPFVLMTAGSIVSLTRLVVNGSIGDTLPANDPYYAGERESAAYFLPNDFIIASVDLDAGDRVGTLARVADLSRIFESLDGVERVLSLATVSDITATGDELSFAKLYPGAGGDADVDRILRTIAATPVFREYLVSSDSRAFSVYVFPRPGVSAKTLLPAIEKACSALPGRGVHVLGKSSLEAYVERTVVSDLLRIGSLVLGIILLFELAITRSLLRAFVLWLTTLLPAVWTLALFPPLGLSLGVQTMLVPIIVLALSTAYGIQFYRYLSLGMSPSMAEALDVTTPIIFGAGSTTILGFLSLLASPFVDLRVLGAMVVCGIAFAMAAAFFVLPVLFSGVRVPRIRPFRGSDALAAFSARRQIPIALVIALAVLAAGLLFIRTDYRLEKMLSGRTDLARTIAYFDRGYGGVNELEIVIDTGRDAGLVDPAVFQDIAALRSDLQGQATVSHVLGYTELVDWIRGKLAADPAAQSAVTEAAIGESLELLGYGSSGWGMGSLVDSSYRRAKIVVRFGSDAGSPREAQATLAGLVARIDADMKRLLPATHYVVTGAPLVSQKTTAYLARGQLFGAAIYFALLFMSTLLAFRSWRWALLAILPPFSGMLFYLGVLGWTQVPLNNVSTMAIAAILGVGIDDVLCLIIFFRRRRPAGGPALGDALRMSGSAIIQSTSIIVLAVLALLISRYTSFIQVSLLAGSSFLFCASITLLVIPHFIRRFGGRLT